MSYTPDNSQSVSDQYVLRGATSADADELYHFMFDQVDRNIRNRSLEEIKSFIADQLIFVIILRRTSRIVGACYLFDPGIDGSWELSGVFLQPDMRGVGLAFDLAAVAITTVYLATHPTKSVRAVVVCDNTKPRKLLLKLRFTCVQNRVVVHYLLYSGLEHMPTDEHGFIYIDIFEQLRAGLLAALKHSLSLISRNDREVQILLLQQSDALEQVIYELEREPV